MISLLLNMDSNPFKRVTESLFQISCSETNFFLVGPTLGARLITSDGWNCMWIERAQVAIFSHYMGPHDIINWFMLQILCHHMRCFS